VKNTELDFDEWHRAVCCKDCDQRCPHREWERKAFEAGKEAVGIALSLKVHHVEVP
jgi:hypothetical protein